MALIKSMVSSKTNEWETPQWFFDMLHAEFKFTLDPCATEKNHKCKKYYTLIDNGLNHDWSNDIVFLNPPFGGNTGAWIKKALEESKKGAIVVCLIVSSTDRSYWHDYIFPFASQIRFIRGRLSFGNAKSTAPFASAIVIFSNRVFQEKIVFYRESISKYKNTRNQLSLFSTKHEGGEGETMKRKTMKIKMWCLIHKPKNKIIEVWSGNGDTVGFATKRDLLEAIDEIVEYDEEIRKIEFEI